MREATSLVVLTIPDEEFEEKTLRFIQYFDDALGKKEYIVQEVEAGRSYEVTKEDGNELFKELKKKAKSCIKIF